jgi:hypothetical protein
VLLHQVNQEPGPPGMQGMERSPSFTGLNQDSKIFHVMDIELFIPDGMEKLNL